MNSAEFSLLITEFEQTYKDTATPYCRRSCPITAFTPVWRTAIRKKHGFWKTRADRKFYVSMHPEST